MLKEFRNILLVVLLFFLPFSEPGGEELAVVTMATTNWAPYYSQDLPEGGPLPEITRVVLERVGYKLDLSFVPWKRAQFDVRHGKYMGLLGAYRTPEREAYALYNKEPILSTVSGIFALDGREIEAETLQDLEPYRIGLLRGTSVNRDFDKATLTKHLTDSEESAVRMLLAERVDAIAGDYWVFRGIIKNLNVERPLRTVLLLGEEHLYNAFSKRAGNYRVLKEDFDRGFEMIKADGTYSRLLEKHGLLREERGN